ncbi:hypothetical protein F4553_004625 [Allocatelliglobosispora scoriae]|uniref:Uncharacterized protein n=1 Tax=Allocatelliglobosispora scoriae TaxID=643052 RepID=A0A841BUW6_9ACTN|nr:hypothetical protein [Allocatelliglobosispora scoriae]MBB5871246.1 hypothetical protein [Allocatelliglobosispora scoriae]
METFFGGSVLQATLYLLVTDQFMHTTLFALVLVQQLTRRHRPA